MSLRLERLSFGTRLIMEYFIQFFQVEILKYGKSCLFIKSNNNFLSNFLSVPGNASYFHLPSNETSCLLIVKQELTVDFRANLQHELHHIFFYSSSYSAHGGLWHQQPFDAPHHFFYYIWNCRYEIYSLMPWSYFRDTFEQL